MSPEEISHIIENRDFIKSHSSDDPFKLLLKYAKQPEKKVLVEQIQARQKIRKKLPDWLENPNIIFPNGLSLEQASSQATAELKASLVNGYELLDITGGLGVDCFYLSESFTKSTYVEQNAELAEVAQHNFEISNTNIKIIIGDGIKTLEGSEADFIYVDPYRRDDAKSKVVALSDCLPDVTQLLDLLVSNGRKSLIKASPMLDISLALEQLKFVSEVWIISHRNDCKEVLFLMDAQTKSVRVKTFDIYPERIYTFEFLLDELTEAKATIDNPENYLYEPNASILKSGGQDILSKKLKVKKLHPNSNFYTSTEVVTDFPGKTFMIKQLFKPFDKSLTKGRFNVISRNFPEKANEIEQKLKLKPSYKDYLIATRLMDGSYTFIVCELLSRAE